MRQGVLLSVFSIRRSTLLPTSFIFHSGSVSIDNVEYRWKSKGTGSKIVVRRHRQVPRSVHLTTRFQLVNQGSNETVAQSHSRIRSSFFRKPRDMSLEISETISHAADTVLLTFILVWRERQNERSKNTNLLLGHSVPPLSFVTAGG